jgi:hypothetical protein
MSEIKTEITPEVDPIEVIYTGECLSLSRRSTLLYAIGRHAEDGTLHLAITGNSGGGMFCPDWVSASAIQDVVMGESALVAKNFLVLTPGKSINTGGFVQAAVKDLGLIRPNAENTRIHEHIPTTTIQQLVNARISGAQSVSPKRRKARED